MGFGDIFGNLFKKKSSLRDRKPQKCPSCSEMITLDMERCPKCGVRIASMFRVRCPKCKTLNELNASKCSKCLYEFEPQEERPKKTYYVCPICGHKSEVFLTRCIVCNTRFV